MSVPALHGSPGRKIATALLLAGLAAVSFASAGFGQSIFSGDAATAPKKMKRVERPKLTSTEYRLSWGLQSIEADRAYARGITGAGVTVAMIDTGVASQQSSGLGSL